MGDSSDFIEQISKLSEAINNNGVLTVENGEFSVYSCFDKNGNSIGYELVSKSKGEPLISDYSKGSVLLDRSKESECIGKMNVIEYMKAYNASEVYLNNSGEVIGRSFKGTKLENVAIDNIPEQYIYKTTNELYSQFADDTAMQDKFGSDYDLLTTSEKYQMKEIDYFVRTIDGLDDTAKIEKEKDGLY